MTATKLGVWSTSHLFELQYSAQYCFNAMCIFAILAVYHISHISVVAFHVPLHAYYVVVACHLLLHAYYVVVYCHVFFYAYCVVVTCHVAPPRPISARNLRPA